MMKTLSVIVGLMLVLGFMSVSIAQFGWTKYEGNPVLLPGESGEFDDYSIFPVSILFDGSTYHLWFGGHDGTRDRIGYASSSDGIIWEKYTGNPVLDVGPAGSWDDERVSGPYVIYDGGTYHMWYGGYDGDKTRIGYATSTDRVIWTKYEGNPVMINGSAGSWESKGVWPDCILFDGDTYQMWYGGVNNASFSRIGYATSADGLSWTKHDGNPIMAADADSWERGMIGAPDVHFDGRLYHMWYTGSTISSWWQWRGGYASSADGINWKKSTINPVLTPDADSWDSQFAAYGRVLWDAATSQYKMWYGGGSSDWYAKLGYAVSAPVLRVPDVYATIQDAINAAADGSVVLVAEGTYYENINFKGKALTVASYYFLDNDTTHISRTIINGSKHQDPDSGSVVYMISDEDTTAVLCGFTITGGHGTKSYRNDRTLRIAGGIMIRFSGGKIIHNHIKQNHIDLVQEEIYCHGGGLLVHGEKNQYAIISDNIISYNTINGWWGGGAGALLCSEGNIICERNVVHHNTYTSANAAGGGGIFLFGDDDCRGSLILNSNIISDNQAIGGGSENYGWGGGIYVEQCSPVLTNNLITANTGGEGGGIYIIRTGDRNIVPVLINNTIAFNEARFGGGINNQQASTVVINTILWQNLATITAWSHEIYDGSSNIRLRSCLVEGGWQGDVADIYDQDPKFIDAENGNFELSESSPCVGSGIDSVTIDGIVYKAPPTDCKGHIRPCVSAADDRIDIGAFESSYATYVQAPDVNLPAFYALDQNYPNPFNPKTTITYQVPVSSYVDLSIYNILGQKVITLVSEKKGAGRHQAEFIGENLSSGVYLYRIEAGDYQAVRKMVLIK